MNFKFTQYAILATVSIFINSLKLISATHIGILPTLEMEIFPLIAPMELTIQL